MNREKNTNDATFVQVDQVVYQSGQDRYCLSATKDAGYDEARQLFLKSLYNTLGHHQDTVIEYAILEQGDYWLLDVYF